MTSTVTLPTGMLPTHSDAENNSPSKSHNGYEVEHPVSPAPTLQYRSNHESIEMNTFRGEATLTLNSSARVPEVPAWTMSLREERIAIATCCGCTFMNGWNDATTGPLLPTIQSHYSIGFVAVSMLFVSNCVGYVLAALVNIHLTDRLGFGKVLILGSVLKVLAYSIIAPTPPFPVMCIVYCTTGFGISPQSAPANSFIAQLPNNASAKMGLLHASYGMEVTVGGWIVTFIIEVRGSGLMLGRILLLPINKRIGERRVVYLYCLLAIGLELVIWLVPNIIGNALAVCFIGVLLGPMFPIAMNTTSSIAPRRILTGSIGWIASSDRLFSIYDWCIGSKIWSQGTSTNAGWDARSSYRAMDYGPVRSSASR